MGYRVLFLANPVKLSIKNEQLQIDNGEVVRIPMEDIECIVVDTAQLNVTAYLLTKICEYNISFYITDRSHHPSGVLLPLAENHSRHMSVLNDQISMTLPTKKKLWKQIVYQKIENQAATLKLCGIEDWNEVDRIKCLVKAGDTDNMEAVAASKYFRCLFGKQFKRAAECTTNAALNYGYAIIRGTIEKYLMAYGYEPSLGLFHKSAVNSFNLADDLIEAYRPMVDLFVARNVDDQESLSTATKAQLVNLLNCDVVIDNRLFACARAIELTVSSLTGFIRGNRNDLLLPHIIDLEQHKYE